MANEVPTKLEGSLYDTLTTLLALSRISRGEKLPRRTLVLDTNSIGSPLDLKGEKHF